MIHRLISIAAAVAVLAASSGVAPNGLEPPVASPSEQTRATAASTPTGRRETLVANLSTVQGGTSRISVIGATASGIRANSTTVRYTYNPVVASVELKLQDSIIPAESRGKMTQLLVTARDPSGAVIIGSGSYVDVHGKPLTIWINNTSPSNTHVWPYAFRRPMPSQGASDSATVTYLGRAHFHYPTFTVANAGLPSQPNGGVTLTYPPGAGDSLPDPLLNCVGESGNYPSVGGFHDGGPYFVLPPVQRRQTGCNAPAAAQIWRTPGAHDSGAYYTITSKYDDSLTLGFGSDKLVYFAYGSLTDDNMPTTFGYLQRSWDRTSAKIAEVPGLNLGNDGGLWFRGRWHGQGEIGTLPPAGSRKWQPHIFLVPDADAVFSVEPGIGQSEVFLYRAHRQLYVGKIDTNLQHFERMRVLTKATDPQVGDLLAGPNDTFYASGGTGANVYKLSNSGVLSVLCNHVERIYRLADGTGIGYRVQASDTEPHAVVHIIPAQNACVVIPVFPRENNAHNGPFFDLLGIDSTTDDWIFYSNPTGHRLGVF